MALASGGYNARGQPGIASPNLAGPACNCNVDIPSIVDYVQSPYVKRLELGVFSEGLTVPGFIGG